MKNSFVSQILIGLLLIAIPIQNLYAIDDTSAVPTKRGMTAQFKETMKHFSRAVRSFVRCAATGECSSDHQRKLVAEIGDLSKKLVQLLAMAGVVGIGAFFARKQFLSDLAAFEKKIDTRQKEIDERLQKGYETISTDLAKGKEDLINTIDTRATKRVRDLEAYMQNEGIGKITAKTAETAREPLKELRTEATQAFHEAVKPVEVKTPLSGKFTVEVKKNPEKKSEEKKK